MRVLTLQHLRDILDYDPTTGLFRWRSGKGRKRPGRLAGNSNQYVHIMIDKRVYLAHRLAWLYVHGEWPPEVIDHINGNGLDNRIVNLRAVSRSDNQRNLSRFSNNKSGVVGVRYRERQRKWIADIWDGCRLVQLGSFAEFSEAVAARKAAELFLGYHPNHGRSKPEHDCAKAA